MESLILILYFFLFFISCREIFKRYKFNTSDENYNEEKIIKKVLLLMGELFFGIAVLNFLGAVILKSFDGKFLSYKNILFIVFFSLVEIAIFIQIYSKFRKPRRKMDVYIEKRYAVFILPFLLVVLLLEKI